MVTRPPRAQTGPISSQTALRRLWSGLFLFAWLMLALFALLPTMVFSPHLASPLGVRVAQVAALMAILLVLWECRVGGLLNLPDPRTGDRIVPLKTVLLRALVIGVAAGLISFSSVQDGLLGLVTSAIGEPGSRDLTITAVVGRSRRTCAHFETEEVGLVLNRALCASKQQLAQGVRGARLRVTGKRSPFGLNVERREVLPPLP